MCIYSQTTYSCKHNIETLTELCDLGRTYKPSMHNKLIIGIHESKDKCEACGGLHDLIDLTQDIHNPIDLTQDTQNPIHFTQDTQNPIDLTQDEHNHIDLTQDHNVPSYQDFEYQDTGVHPEFFSKKRARRDSAFDFEGYKGMPRADIPADSHPAHMDTGA